VRWRSFGRNRVGGHGVFSREAESLEGLAIGRVGMFGRGSDSNQEVTTRVFSHEFFTRSGSRNGCFGDKWTGLETCDSNLSLSAVSARPLYRDFRRRRQTPRPRAFSQRTGICSDSRPIEPASEIVKMTGPCGAAKQPCMTDSRCR